MRRRLGSDQAPDVLPLASAKPSLANGQGDSSTVGAAFNMLCVVVGTGLLQLPYGVRQSGWVGVPLLVMMAVMACYTAVILGRCLHLARAQAAQRVEGVLAFAGAGALSPARPATPVEPASGAAGTPLLAQGPAIAVAPEPQPPTLAAAASAAATARIQTYGDIGHAAYGSFGRWFVVVQMHVTLVMVGTIYQLLTSINMVDVVGPGGWLTETRAALLLGAVLWLHVFLKTLSEVAVLSYLNILINVALLVVVVTQAAAHPPAEPPTHAFVGRDVRAFGSAFASFGFAYGVHPMIPSIIQSMRSPAHFAPMAVASFVGVLCFYVRDRHTPDRVPTQTRPSPTRTCPSLTQTRPPLSIIAADGACGLRDLRRRRPVAHLRDCRAQGRACGESHPGLPDGPPAHGLPDRAQPARASHRGGAENRRAEVRPRPCSSATRICVCVCVCVCVYIYLFTYNIYVYICK